MFKENVSVLIMAAAIIAGAVILKPVAINGPFQVLSADGAVYRLNQNTGRIDVLVPTSEGALMMPVGQISAPMKENMSEEERKQFSSFLKTVAQYLQIERSKSLGLKVAPPENSVPAK